MKPIAFLSLLAVPIVGLLLVPEAPSAAPNPNRWQVTVDKAVSFLKGSQEDNGGWSTAKSPGITGVALTGLLRSGKMTANDPTAEKALKYIEGLINPKGHLAGKDPKVQLQNYVTCINVLALVEAKRADKYEKVIGNAAQFLKQLQWDEGEGKAEKDDFFGGAGYDSKSRPDLSNTQFFLDALKAAGVPKDDPAFKNALVFVSRCQNLKSEYNDQPWAGKVNDGSFIYTAATGGVTKVIDKPGDDGAVPGYASMTYAGIKSMIYCGVTKDDPRMKTAVAWIRKNYSVERNPGMPEARKDWGLFYYYHTMAKCLDALGEDEFVDDKGAKHDWRADLTAALARQQQADGSWASKNQWLEGDANLVTGYALMTLSYCRPKQ